MNDRELLELAAKAAGIDPVLANPIEFSTGTEYYWNPLADDGDALRLAVKMRIQITPGTYNKDEFSAYSSAGTEAKEYWSSLKDERSAVRRAIVRAAAAIGEAMP